MAAIFTYGFAVADESFKNADCPYFTLSDYSILVLEALKSGFVTEQQINSLSEWRNNPAIWKK
jgi:orotate phosphoribosyltransferase